MEQTPRRNFRITTYLKARLVDDLPGSEGYVTVSSEHGLFFLTLEPRSTITLEAQVVYNSSFDKGLFEEHGMGLKFPKINDDARAFIRGFILEQIAAGIVRMWCMTRPYGVIRKERTTMAGIVSRRPMVGVAAGFIIGALGMLLLGIDPAAAGQGLAGLLFKVSGWFFLFVSAMAFLGAFLSFRNKRSSSRSCPDTQGRKAGA